MYKSKCTYTENMKLIQPPDVLQKCISLKNILKTVNHIDVLTADFSLLPL